ncbi:MAG: TatD family hydrolase [Bdellovibrionales bacterium]|nr:TatD family hydrolase [Bdellovibrionales bacterium]
MSGSTGWIDVHTHLNMLESSPEWALEEAQKNDVSRMITIGTGPEDWPIVQELAKNFFPRVGCTLGLHPHEASIWNISVADDLEKNLANPHVLAVGEIGLDYHYNSSPREIQLKAFREQLDLAVQFKLPVEIHTREAEDDTIALLKEYEGRISGLLHCFTSSWKLAEVALDKGFNLSFSGVITFKNSEDLRAVCLKTPLNQMHVETDAPFLAPVPYRGKKNCPAWVATTAEFISKLKSIEKEELKQITFENAAKMFPKWKLKH